jgi:nitrate/TMAO reductase-like tetraheme cytochrome c subunit
VGEALVVDTSLRSSVLSLGASVEAGVGIFVDFKTASKTLAILLFLAVIVVAIVSFTNPIVKCSSACELCVSDSYARPALASTVTVGIFSKAKGITPACSAISILFVSSIVAILSKE